MAQLKYPSVLIRVASDYGVQLDNVYNYNPELALRTLAEELELVQMYRTRARMNGDVRPLRVMGEFGAPLRVSAKVQAPKIQAPRMTATGPTLAEPAKKRVNPFANVISTVKSAAQKQADYYIQSPLRTHAIQTTVKKPPAAVLTRKKPILQQATNIIPTVKKTSTAILRHQAKKPAQKTGFPGRPSVEPIRLTLSPEEIEAQLTPEEIKRRKTARGQGKIPLDQLLTPIKQGTTVTSDGIKSFGIKNPNVNVQGAMATADRLLGDPNVDNASLIVNNTQALAALGDEVSQLGLLVLDTVQQIRESRDAQPGQRVIAGPPVAADDVVYVTPPETIVVMAEQAEIEKPSVWKRILGWFGLQVKDAQTA